MTNQNPLSERLIRFCGADCGRCDTYKRFLAGDESGLVNPDNDYRCCWLPKNYPRGTDCPIRTCCEEKGILFCGQCSQLEGCAIMEEFYSKPGYDRLRKRMFEQIAKMNSPNRVAQGQNQITQKGG
jgi:hypothetical protein